MCKTEEYIDGTKGGKIAFFGFIIIVLAFSSFVNFYTVDIEFTEASDIELSLKQQLPVLFAITIFYISLSGLILKFFNSYIKHGFWPPPGFPVPFRTRVSRLKHPLAVRVSVFVVLSLFVAYLGIKYYSWFKLYNIAVGI